MGDEADRADKSIEDVIVRGIEAARKAVKPPVYHTECNWCGDPTEGGARYCCKDCASDAFRYNCSLKRNGVSRD